MRDTLSDSDHDKLKTDLPRYCDEDCNCENCHEDHDVRSNAVNFPESFDCCVIEFAKMKKDGEVCEKHPLSYCENANEPDKKYCEGCDE